MRHRLLLFGDTAGGFGNVPRPLLDSLVAYYDLANVNDASGNGNTLTNNGVVTFSGSGGKPGAYANFVAASSQYLTIADNASLSTTGSLTYAFWCQFNDLTAIRPLVCKGSYLSSLAGQCEFAVGFTNSDNLIRARIRNTADTTNVIVQAISLGLPVVGTWYHVVAWHDAVAQTVNIQVNNGTVNSVVWTGGMLDGTNPFRIGTIFSAGFYHDGLIDSVGVWKRVLTAAEKTWLYNAGSGRDYAAVAAYTG